MAQTAPLYPHPPPNLAVRTVSPNKQSPTASPTLAFDDSKWAPRSAESSSATGAGWGLGDAEPFTKRGSTALYTSSEPDSWRRPSRNNESASRPPAFTAMEPSPHHPGSFRKQDPFQSRHESNGAVFGADSTRRLVQPCASDTSASQVPLGPAHKESVIMEPRSVQRLDEKTSTWFPSAQSKRSCRPSNPPGGILKSGFFVSPPASVGSADLPYINFGQSHGDFQSSNDRLDSAFQSMNVSNDMSSFRRTGAAPSGKPPPSTMHSHSFPSSRIDNLSSQSFNTQQSPHEGSIIDYSTCKARLPPVGASNTRFTSSIPQRGFLPAGRGAKPDSENSDTWHTPDPRGQIAWRESRFGIPYPEISEALPPIPYPYHQGFATSTNPMSLYSGGGISPFAQQQIPQAGLPMSKDESETSSGLRSPRLADFRNSGGKNSKKWELKDIYNYVVEFSGDHHGSLFIQSKLEKAKTEEKEVLFREIQSNAVPLMKDVFGNYVLQKFFEHGDHLQKRILVNSMRGQVPELSKHVYGCRVVQTAFNHILVEQQQALVKELESCVMECVKNENGNHVIQIAIRLVPMEYLQTMIDQFYGHVQHLATHRYGCRIIQRLLESCKDHVLNRLLEELHECTPQLIVDTYGNYVPQHIVQHGELHDRNRIIDVVQRNLVGYSKQKFASNVVEKCVKYGTEEQRREIMQQLLRQDAHECHELLCFLIRDGYGNYVVQSLLDHLGDQDYIEFVHALEPALRKAREVSPNKQSENVAKKMQRLKTPRYGWNCPPNSGHHFGHYSTFRGCAPPQINTQISNGRLGSSAVSTPPLTVAETESPVSNAFSSMTDIARQESNKDQREWRKDSAINFEAPDRMIKD